MSSSEVGREEEEEEYKQQANLFKEQGNEAFQAGNVDLAIKYFTQAIDIDPDNHIIYSNRSAAYMKLNYISKALHDAEKCVEIAPNWSKGYNRLGTAQQALKRFDAAIQTYKRGIELDPNNPSLWSCLKLCEKAYEQDKQEKFQKGAIERQQEEERMRRREEIRNDLLKQQQKKEEENLLNNFFDEIQQDPAPSSSSGKETKEGNEDPASEMDAHQEGEEVGGEGGGGEEEDNLLASFFTEVNTTKKEPKPQETTVSEKDGGGEGDEESKNVLTEKYVKQQLGSGKEIVERLMCSFHEWKNLNPYRVFQLDIDATEEDIKYRYKKLSLKVHPDRLRDVENAREAFEQVKASYEKLTDDDARKTVIAHIENVTDDLKRDRKRLLRDSGLTEEDLPDFEEERQKRIMKHFADLEQMRRLSEKNKRLYSAREKQQEAEEEHKAQKFEDFEKEWGEQNRREKRVGNWRDFQYDPTTKKVRAANYKEEKRNDIKFGKVQLETWKKSWK